mgnify:CR=1 FL=1
MAEPGKNGGAGDASTAIGWIGAGQIPGAGRGGGHAPPPGGGDGAASDPYARRDWVDARIETLRTEVNAGIDGLNRRLDQLPTFRQMVATVAGIIVVGLTISVTVLGLMQDRFESGIESGSTFGSNLERQRATLEQLERQNTSILERLERQEGEPK